MDESIDIRRRRGKEGEKRVCYGCYFCCAAGEDCTVAGGVRAKDWGVCVEGCVGRVRRM